MIQRNVLSYMEVGCQQFAVMKTGNGDIVSVTVVADTTISLTSGARRSTSDCDNSLKERSQVK